MLEVKNLQVAYGESEIINQLSFSVGTQETLAIMGRNGMGKTTLMKALIGILRCRREGRSDSRGRDLTRLDSFRRVGTGLAYVPQGRQIFPTLTVEENIRTGLATARKRQDRPLDLHAVSRAQRDAPPAGRKSLRRTAAAARHRAGSGLRAQGAAARRADRGNSALDHQGHRPHAQRDQEDRGTSRSSWPNRCSASRWRSPTASW